MSPTWARKGSKRWRYYVSQAALQGDKSKAGSIVRVPAAEVEALVTEAVGKLSADRPASQTDIRDRIDRVAIGGTAIQIRLSEVGEGNDSVKTLTVGAASRAWRLRCASRIKSSRLGPTLVSSRFTMRPLRVAMSISAARRAFNVGNGLDLLRLSGNFKSIAAGLMLLSAVCLDMVLRRGRGY